MEERPVKAIVTEPPLISVLTTSEWDQSASRSNSPTSLTNPELIGSNTNRTTRLVFLNDAFGY
jgi:hypothetical protein